MALLTTATEDNRVVDAALHVTYARRKTFGSWTYVMANVTITLTEAWEYVRTAVKSYRYVGLDKATALSVAAALTQLYTRPTKVSEFDTETESQTYGTFKHVAAGSVPMADVVPQHEDGAMWSVVVAVNETDTRLSLSALESFASLFSAEEQRDYDADPDGPLGEEEEG